MTRLVVFSALVALVLTPARASAADASLVDIEGEVMCVTCKVPLNIAESPQADRQRDLIRRLIDRGLDKQQIKAALVSEYGRDVLALPEGKGFGMTAYAMPIGLLAALTVTLALLLPRWRARAPAAVRHDSTDTLSSDDARRLEEDLARHDR